MSSLNEWPCHDGTLCCELFEYHQCNGHIYVHGYFKQAGDCSQLEGTAKCWKPEAMQMFFSTPFDNMPAGVWVQPCCRHIYCRSTLISAGRGRHRSAMTAPVNVWTTEDTSSCHTGAGYHFKRWSVCAIFFKLFFLARQDKNCAAISATNSHRNANNFAVCHADARQVERLVLMLSSQFGGQKSRADESSLENEPRRQPFVVFFGGLYILSIHYVVSSE